MQRVRLSARKRFNGFELSELYLCCISGDIARVRCVSFNSSIEILSFVLIDDTTDVSFMSSDSLSLRASCSGERSLLSECVKVCDFLSFTDEALLGKEVELVSHTGFFSGFLKGGGSLSALSVCGVPLFRADSATVNDLIVNFVGPSAKEYFRDELH